MQKLLNVEIVTPSKVIFGGQALSVKVPGSKSPFQVLPNHAPIVSSLTNGKIEIEDTNKNIIAYNTNSGFVEINNNKVSILVEKAEAL